MPVPSAWSNSEEIVATRGFATSGGTHASSEGGPKTVWAAASRSTPEFRTIAAGSSADSGVLTTPTTTAVTFVSPFRTTPGVT